MSKPHVSVYFLLGLVIIYVGPSCLDCALNGKCNKYLGLIIVHEISMFPNLGTFSSIHYYYYDHI